VRKTIAAALLFSALLLAAGCGSSNKTSAPKTSSESQTTKEAVTNPTTTAVKGTGKMDSSCLSMVKLGSELSKAASAATGGTTDLGKQAQASVKVFKAYVAAAPSEIRPDMVAFEKAFEAYAVALGSVHVTAGKQPSATDMAKLLSASKVLSAPALRAHSAHIAAWSAKHCGTPTPTSTG
jgi:hypothetical protein